MRLRDHDPAAALRWVIPVVLFVGIISMPREEYLGDPRAVRCETVSLINNGNIEIPAEVAITFTRENGKYFYVNYSKRKLYSKYGIMNGLMNVPPLLAEKWWDGALPYFSPSRVIFLNVFNLILSMASAGYLCLIAGRYTSSLLTMILFVLSAFYCTYWWNYLRAQNSEIYQVLFMLAFYYHFTSRFKPSAPGLEGAERWARERQMFAAGIFLGALILVKTAYVILLPLVFAWIAVPEIARFRPGPEGKARQICGALLVSSRGIAIPVLGALAVLLAVNAYKFGSPFESGYGQWGQNNKPIFSGNFLPGLYELLFSVRGSIFLHFPILIFALFGYSYFFKNHLADTALFVSSGVLLLLLYGKMLNPLGLACYGPRYMLVILPLLSLPFVKTLDFLLSNLKRWRSAVGLAVMALSLSYSLRLQLNVNALPFFTGLQLQALFSGFHDRAVDGYFASHDDGAINGDILAAKKGQSLPLLQMVGPKLTPQALAGLVGAINQATPSNYYWWP